MCCSGRTKQSSLPSLIDSLGPPVPSLRRWRGVFRGEHGRRWRKPSTVASDSLPNGCQRSPHPAPMSAPLSLARCSRCLLAACGAMITAMTTSLSGCCRSVRATVCITISPSTPTLTLRTTRSTHCIVQGRPYLAPAIDRVTQATGGRGMSNDPEVNPTWQGEPVPRAAFRHSDLLSTVVRVRLHWLGLCDTCFDFGCLLASENTARPSRVRDSLPSLPWAHHEAATVFPSVSLSLWQPMHRNLCSRCVNSFEYRIKKALQASPLLPLSLASKYSSPALQWLGRYARLAGSGSYLYDDDACSSRRTKQWVPDSENRVAERSRRRAISTGPCFKLAAPISLVFWGGSVALPRSRAMPLLCIAFQRIADHVGVTAQHQAHSTSNQPYL